MNICSSESRFQLAYFSLCEVVWRPFFLAATSWSVLPELMVRSLKQFVRCLGLFARRWIVTLEGEGDEQRER